MYSSLNRGISFLQPKKTYEIPRGHDRTGSTLRHHPRRQNVGHHQERRSSICGKASKRCATDQSGGNGDQNGGTGSRPDASSRDSIRMQRMKAAASKRRKDASSRRRRRFAQDANDLSPAERATQSQLGKMRPSFQGLTLKKGKLDLKGPHKKRAERRKAYEAKLQPEVVGATSRAPPENLTEGRSPTDTPSIGSEIHKSLSKETDEASGSPRSQRCAR
jgi:hypothetical protein